jgi:2-methylisocitrate lyase-like PEP mutase family enzyme
MTVSRTDPGAALDGAMASGPLLVPGCYDCLSAAILQQAGFPALFLSGAGVAASALGLPDLGLMSFGELLQSAERIIRRATVPVIVDADTGFGNELNVTRTVAELAQAGAAAIVLEDQRSPKRCGHLIGKDVTDRADFARKIRAATRERDRGDGGLRIVARTDALGVHGVEDAIARGQDALEAGADVVFVEAPRTVAEVEAIGARVDGRLLYNLATGGSSPSLTVSELGELGYDLVIVPGIALMPAVHGIRAAAEAVRAANGDQPLERFDLTPRQIFESVGLDAWLELESRLADEALDK